MENKKKPTIRFRGFCDAWEQRKLGDVVEVTSGFTGDPLLLDGEYHLTRIETIADGIVDENRVGYSNKKPDDMYLLKQGDILYSNINSISHMGKVAKYQGNTPLYHGINLLRLQPEDNINSDFLLYLLNTEKCRNWAKTRANQAVSQASINQSLLTMQEIVISSFEEEKQIGAFFRQLDHLTTLHQRKYDKLLILKKSMLEKMFPKNDSTVPEIRFKGFTHPWEQRKLGELGEIMTGATPSTSKLEYYSEDGIPWVTPTDINALTISDTPRKLSEEGMKVGRVVSANTVLCTCIASIGKNALLTVKGSFNQQINSLTPSAENDSYFLLTESELWSKKMKRMAASGTMQIVNKTEFSEIDTMVPLLDEQKIIGSYFRNVDHLITLHQRKLEKLKNIKKSLLEKMFV